MNRHGNIVHEIFIEKYVFGRYLDYNRNQTTVINFFLFLLLVNYLRTDVRGVFLIFLGKLRNELLSD